MRVLKMDCENGKIICKNEKMGQKTQKWTIIPNLFIKILKLVVLFPFISKVLGSKT